MTNYNPFLIVVLGDFNVKSENWYKHDKTLYEGAKIDAITTQFGLQQTIKEPTHILDNLSPSLISYLRPTKIWQWNPEFTCPFMQISTIKLPYERKMWHYKPLVTLGNPVPGSSPAASYVQR